MSDTALRLVGAGDPEADMRRQAPAERTGGAAQLRVSGVTTLNGLLDPFLSALATAPQRHLQLLRRVVEDPVHRAFYSTKLYELGYRAEAFAYASHAEGCAVAAPVLLRYAVPTRHFALALEAFGRSQAVSLSGPARHEGDLVVTLASLGRYEEAAGAIINSPRDADGNIRIMSLYPLVLVRAGRDAEAAHALQSLAYRSPEVLREPVVYAAYCELVASQLCRPIEERLSADRNAAQAGDILSSLAETALHPRRAVDTPAVAAFLDRIPSLRTAYPDATPAEDAGHRRRVLGASLLRLSGFVRRAIPAARQPACLVQFDDDAATAAETVADDRRQQVALSLPGGVRIPDARWPVDDWTRYKVRILRFTNAIVEPDWLVVGADRRVPVRLNDISLPVTRPFFGNHNRATLEYPGIVYADHRAALVRPAKRQETADEPLFLPFHNLVQWTWFGHWILDTMTRLAMFKRLGFARDHRLLMPELTEPYQFETLELFGFAASQIRIKQSDTALVCRQLTAVETGHWPFYRYLREAAEDFDLPDVTAQPFVYLSRRRIKRRSIVNEEEVEAVLSERGFQIVHPQEHSLREQIAIMRQAEAVVSSTGSATCNLAFCKPGIRHLGLYTVSDPVETAEHYRSFGPRMWAMSAVNPTRRGSIPDHQFHVPIDRLRALVDDMLSSH